MRIWIVPFAVVTLAAASLAAQQAPRQSYVAQVTELMRKSYLRQQIQTACRGHETVVAQIDGPSSEAVELDCGARRQFMQDMLYFYRLPEVEKACAADPTAAAAPTEPMSFRGEAPRSYPVNCVARATDLPRIEEWLRE